MQCLILLQPPCSCAGVLTKVDEKTEAEASNAACVKELRAYASSQLEVLGAAAARTSPAAKLRGLSLHGLIWSQISAALHVHRTRTLHIGIAWSERQPTNGIRCEVAVSPRLTSSALVLFLFLGQNISTPPSNSS